MKIHYLLPLLFTLSVHAAEDRQPYVCDNGSRLDISFSADADGRLYETLILRRPSPTRHIAVVGQ